MCIRDRLESVKEGSEQEYQLKIQQLQAQQEAELTSTEQTEEMKFRVTAADYTAKKFTVIPRPGHSDWKPAEQMVLRCV